jgi:hypothetical protein
MRYSWRRQPIGFPRVSMVGKKQSTKSSNSKMGGWRRGQPIYSSVSSTLSLFYRAILMFSTWGFNVWRRNAWVSMHVSTCIKWHFLSCIHYGEETKIMWLMNPMQLNHSIEANIFSVTQYIPLNSMKPEDSYHIYKLSPLVPFWTKLIHYTSSSFTSLCNIFILSYYFA